MILSLVGLGVLGNTKYTIPSWYSVLGIVDEFEFIVYLKSVPFSSVSRKRNNPARPREIANSHSLEQHVNLPKKPFKDHSSVTLLDIECHQITARCCDMSAISGGPSRGPECLRSQLSASTI